MAPSSINDLDFIPPDSFGPEILFVVGVLILGVALGALIVAMFIRAAKLSSLRNEANRSLTVNASTPLTEGPARVVRGRVESLGQKDAAVELVIVQRVKNHTHKNSRSHTWEEESRTLSAEPFLIHQDNGETVFVEPGNNVIVVDSIETEYPQHMPFQRARKSDVKRGEVVFAYGDLVRGPNPAAQPGYRGPGSGWVLRPPQRAGRMLLATNLVESRYQARVSYLLKAGSVLAVLWLVYNMFTSVPLVFSTVLGETVPATIVDLDTYTTRSKRSTTTHWRVKARTPDGLILTRDVPSDTYIALSNARAANRALTIPVIDTLGLSWASYLGTVPYASMALLGIGALAWAITMGAVFATYKERYDWYDKKKLNEPGGNGHWQETRPTGA